MTALRLMIRSLARTPLFTLTAVVSLALGIGANTAIFSLLDHVVLRALPVYRPEELVFLYHPGPSQGSISSDESGGPSFSYPMFRELQQRQTAFAALAGGRMSPASLAYKGTALAGQAHLVSGNYFDVLGVGAAIGRVFTPDDDTTIGGHPVVVLSHSYWTSRFAADPSVLNETMIVNGHPMTIVGVTRKGFVSEMPGSVPDVFVPISMKAQMTPDFDGFKNRKDYWVSLFARLKPGQTLQQSETAINVAYREQHDQDVALLSHPSPDFLQRFKAKHVVLRPGAYGRGSLRDDGRRPLTLLMAMTVLVLLIACANVANLQLARATSRTREVAVRLAMGASRGQLVRQLLAESCLVAVAGGLLGLAVAHWTLQGILAALPDAGSGLLSANLDAGMLLFALALSIATGLLFGLYPAVRASKAQLTAALRDQSGQTTATRETGRLRKVLVTMQAAMALLLLISAGLFGRTLVNLSRIDLGIRTDHLMTFTLTPKLNGYDDARAVQFFRDVTARLSALPGVRLVSAARIPAIAGSSSSGNITVEGFTPQRDGDDDSHVNAVGPGYFRTLGIPLIRGREIAESDTAASPKVVVVNEAFVRHFLPGRDPIGVRMAPGGGNSVKLDMTIVGVVKDAKYSDMREPPPSLYYTAYQQLRRQSEMSFYVRTALESDSLAAAIRRETAALDPNLPIRELKTMKDQIDENTANERLLSMFTGGFAALATLLAAVGLYGVLAYNVARRTREIGIRMALGASAGHVRGLVVRDVLLMLGIGGLVGLSAAAAVGKLVESVLYGMRPWDPLVYTGATVVLGLIALAAAYVPARRATAVDPMTALRYE